MSLYHLTATDKRNVRLLLDLGDGLVYGQPYKIARRTVTLDHPTDGSQYTLTISHKDGDRTRTYRGRINVTDRAIQIHRRLGQQHGPSRTANRTRSPVPDRLSRHRRSVRTMARPSHCSRPPPRDPGGSTVNGLRS